MAPKEKTFNSLTYFSASHEASAERQILENMAQLSTVTIRHSYNLQCLVCEVRAQTERFPFGSLRVRHQSATASGVLPTQLKVPDCENLPSGEAAASPFLYLAALREKVTDTYTIPVGS